MDKEAEGIIEQVYALLGKAYEKSYGKGYHKPKFRIILTHEDIHCLKRHTANLPIGEKVFLGIDKNMMFGHEIQEQRRTPYLEAVIGELPKEKPPLLSRAEIEHILETQESLCELGRTDKDDGSCSLCRSIKLKLRPKEKPPFSAGFVDE